MNTISARFLKLLIFRERYEAFTIILNWIVKKEKKIKNNDENCPVFPGFIVMYNYNEKHKNDHTPPPPICNN